MTRLALLSLLSLSFCFNVMAIQADPLGQKAHYELDKDPARTSSMIRRGTIDGTVTESLLHANPPAYEVRLDYRFDVMFMGNQSGSKPTKVDAEYFTPEFLEKLRKDGTYAGSNFKAQHLGYADAVNMDGASYPHCDKIRLYDIKTTSIWAQITGEIFETQRADIKNLEALILVYPGVPVLGAVKLDVSGDYNGMHIKAGGDYTP